MAYIVPKPQIRPCLTSELKIYTIVGDTQSYCTFTFIHVYCVRPSALWFAFM